LAAALDAITPPFVREAFRAQRARENSEPRRCVYFIRGTNGRGPIKIGYTERRVSVRLGECAVRYPYPLEVLGTIAGEPSLERFMHRKFSYLRLRGEWFEPADELLAFIRDHAKRTRP
jgi:hypothetical protein